MMHVSQSLLLQKPQQGDLYKCLISACLFCINDRLTVHHYTATLNKQMNEHEILIQVQMIAWDERDASEPQQT